MDDNTQNRAEPRRLLEIEAKEVSLVDRAAIRRKFLIVKRQPPAQEESMTAEETEETEEMSEDEKSAPAAEAVEASTPAPGPPGTSEESEGSEEPEASEDAEPEKAAASDIKEALMKLKPWLTSQADEAEGELKGIIEGLVDMLGESDDSSEPADGEEDTEKATDDTPLAEVLSQLKQISSAMPAAAPPAPAADAAVAKNAGVSVEQFMEHAKVVNSTLTTMAASIAQVSKRFDAFEAIPVAKGAGDPPNKASAKGEAKTDDEIFSGLFG